MSKTEKPADSQNPTSKKSATQKISESGSQTKAKQIRTKKRKYTKDGIVTVDKTARWGKVQKVKGKDGRAIKVNSPRQLILVKKIAEAVASVGDRRKVSIGKLMREAGYSVSYSEKPKDLIESPTFQALLEKYLPDDKLSKVHGELLEASTLKSYTFNMSETDESIQKTIEGISGAQLIRIVVYKTDNGLTKKRAYFQVPDARARQQALAEGYKVKGRYPAEKHDHQVAVVNVTNYAK